jgi:hypothetical protein
MTQAEIRALENAARSSMGWAPEAYDGSTHFGEVARALVPATLILTAAAALLVALL